MKAYLANTAASALYVGEVVHQRSRTFDHRLRYRVWMVLADLDELDGLQSRLGLLGRGRFGLISFRASDHGDRSGRPLMRFSPHFYNTEAEMDRLADLIAAL